MRYKKKPTTIFFIILAITFVLTRTFNLGNDFVGFDAYYFKDWSYVFLKNLESGNFEELPNTIQPGVITIYSNIIGFKLLYFCIDKLNLLNDINIDLALHIFQKTPKVLFISAVTFYITYILNKLYNKRVAIVFLALTTFEPILIGHTRAIQTDMAQATLMFASIITFLYFLSSYKYKYLFFSGYLGGLAFIEKAPSIILLPAILTILIVFVIHNKNQIKKTLIIYFLFTLTFITTAFISYPKYWAHPYSTFKQTTVDAFLFGTKGINTETGSMDKYVDSNALDKTYLNYLFFRHSEVFILLLIFSVVIYFLKIFKPHIQVLYFVTAPVIYFLMLQISEKKFGRYFIFITLFLSLYIANVIGNYIKSKRMFYTFIFLISLTGLVNYFYWGVHNIIGYNNIISPINVSKEWGTGYKTLAQKVNKSYKQGSKLFLADHYSIKPFTSFETYPLEQLSVEKCKKNLCYVVNPNKEYIKIYNLKKQDEVYIKNELLFTVYIKN